MPKSLLTIALFFGTLAADIVYGGILLDPNVPREPYYWTIEPVMAWAEANDEESPEATIKIVESEVDRARRILVRAEDAEKTLESARKLFQQRCFSLFGRTGRMVHARPYLVLVGANPTSPALWQPPRFEWLFKFDEGSFSACGSHIFGWTNDLVLPFVPPF